MKICSSYNFPRSYIWRACYVRGCDEMMRRTPISDISLVNQIFYSCAYFLHVPSFLPVRINYFTYVGHAFVRIILHCKHDRNWILQLVCYHPDLDWLTWADFSREYLFTTCWGCKWVKGTGSCLGDKVHSLLVLWKQREVDRLTKWVQALASETKYKEGIIWINRYII